MWLNDAALSLLGPQEAYLADPERRDLALFYLFLAIQECIPGRPLGRRRGLGRTGRRRVRVRRAGRAWGDPARVGDSAARGGGSAEPDCTRRRDARLRARPPRGPGRHPGAPRIPGGDCFRCRRLTRLVLRLQQRLEWAGRRAAAHRPAVFRPQSGRPCHRGIARRPPRAAAHKPDRNPAARAAARLGVTAICVLRRQSLGHRHRAGCPARPAP
jgi:hypothetical protein